MADNLLLELESEPVAKRLGHVDLLVSEVIQNVARSVEGMQGSVLLFQNAWQSIVTETAKGKTAEMHAVRPRLWGAFAKRLELLQHTHELASWLRQLDPGCVPDPAVLVPEVSGMELLKTRVFDRWQTAEDLEELAARDYPLTTGELDRLAPERRPPASWYAEKNKPF